MPQPGGYGASAWRKRMAQAHGVSAWRKRKTMAQNDALIAG
jgi:hypothetical protein